MAWAADGGRVVGNRARSSPEPLALSMAVIGNFGRAAVAGPSRAAVGRREPGE